MHLELRTETAEDTRRVGVALAALLEPRDAVALTGELAAGKTTFAQGVARGLGVVEQVISPTFTLVREYRGRLRLAHVDVYRLEHVQDVVDLGLEELGDEAVLLVEWGDAIDALLPADHLVVEIAPVDPSGDSQARRVLLSAHGASWLGRWEHLEQALEPWRIAA